MVKNILHLFAICSLILSVQGADSAINHESSSSSSSINQEQIRSILQQQGKSLVPPKASSSSFNYIIKPLSTIYSILPFQSYVSHTYGSSAASITKESFTDNSNTIPKSIASTASSLSTSILFSSTGISQAAAIHAAQLSQPSLSHPSVVQIQIHSSSASIAASVKAPSITNIIAQQLNSNSAPAPGATVTLSPNDSEPNGIVAIEEVEDPEEFIRPCYRRGKKVAFSQYWIPRENEWDENNKGDRVFLGGDVKMKMFDKFDKEIGIVPEAMYQKCRMEGTCLLENGDLMNIEGGNATHKFIKVGGHGREHNVFGLGSGSQNLVPFVSVAANDIPYGQKLYISELDGLDLGNNMKHNGCVRVDDDSWSFDSCQIDFFVVSYVDYLWLDLDDKVSIKYADCEIRNYVTKHQLALMKASTNESLIPSLLHAQKTL